MTADECWDIVVQSRLYHDCRLTGALAMQGTTWDWHSAAHRALDGEVLSALDEVHKLGVLHGDLHEGNILVTPERKVVVLDFDGARLEAPASELIAEQDHVALLLAMQVGHGFIAVLPLAEAPFSKA